MAIDLHLEPGLLEPPRSKTVRLVLGRRGVRAIRAGAAADRVKLVQPFEDTHARSVEAAAATVLGMSGHVE